VLGENRGITDSQYSGIKWEAFMMLISHSGLRFGVGNSDKEKDSPHMVGSIEFDELPAITRLSNRVEFKPE
jgi:hypothetical protein